MGPRWTLKFASDSSLLIELDSVVSALHDPASTDADALHGLWFRLQSLKRAEPAIENLHPAYRGVMVDFDPNLIEPHRFKDTLQEITETLDAAKAPEGRLIEVPVVYGGGDGPDLMEVARSTGLSAEEVVRLHSEVIYDVAFLGFSPGFPYLRGLPNELHCPRKATPRLRVPAGSVAIGGSQTGVYPEESPGGWQIIGRTHSKLFSLEQEPPTLLLPGDRLKFRAVAEEGAEEVAEEEERRRE